MRTTGGRAGDGKPVSHGPAFSRLELDCTCDPATVVEVLEGYLATLTVDGRSLFEIIDVAPDLQSGAYAIRTGVPSE